MEYFVFIICFSCLTLISFIVKDEPEKRVIYYFLILFVVVVTGLRGNTDEYTRFFLHMPTLPDFLSGINYAAVERGYLFAFVCSVLKALGFDVRALFFIVAMTSISIHAVYYRKFTPFYILAFLIYLSHEIYFHEWVQIRAGLASTMVLPMIDALIQHKKSRFIFLVFISSLIQYVGVLSFMLIWLRKEIKTKFILWGLALATVISYTNIVKAGLISLSRFLPPFISVYIQWQAYSYDIGLFHAKAVQQYVFLLGVLYLKSRKTEHPSPYFNIVLNTYFLSTLLFMLFSDLAIFATRFSGHFSVVEPILLTYLSYYFVEKRVYATVLVFVALCISHVNYVQRRLIGSYYLYGDRPSDL